MQKQTEKRETLQIVEIPAKPSDINKSTELLGEPFLAEVEHLEAIHPEDYRHEYLGEVTATGGGVSTMLNGIKIPML